MKVTEITYIFLAAGIAAKNSARLLIEFQDPDNGNFSDD